MEKRSRRPYGSFLKTDKGVRRKPSAESWTKGEQTFLIVLVNHSLKSWTNTDAENFNCEYLVEDRINFHFLD